MPHGSTAACPVEMGAPVVLVAVTVQEDLGVQLTLGPKVEPAANEDLVAAVAKVEYLVTAVLAAMVATVATVALAAVVVR